MSAVPRSADVCRVYATTCENAPRGQGRATVPPVLGPPVEDRAPHERRSKVARRRQVHGETTGGIGGGAAAAAGGGGARRGREQPVARSKAATASSQFVRLSSGSHVSPDASCPAQRTST